MNVLFRMRNLDPSRTCATTSLSDKGAPKILRPICSPGTDYDIVCFPTSILNSHLFVAQLSVASVHVF
jgi:hypothetical protein